MAVVLLLLVIWIAVLAPPALQARAARREAFLVSFGAPPTAEVLTPPPSRARSHCVQRRRRILGGLLIAVAGTGLAGLLPTFRVLLVVHLFLVDSMLAYVALLAHQANRRTAALAPPTVEVDAEVEVDAGARAARPRVRRLRPALLADLPPVASAG